MRKSLLVTVALLLGGLFTAHATVPIRVRMRNVGDTRVLTNAKVRFQLANCAGGPPRLIGTTTVLPQIAMDFTPDSITGIATGNIYANDEIDCAGVRNSVYVVTYIINSVPVQPAYSYKILTINGTFDPSIINPITSIPAVPPPTGDNTYLRLDGGNSGGLGNFIFHGNGLFSNFNTGPDSLPAIDEAGNLNTSTTRGYLAKNFLRSVSTTAGSTTTETAFANLHLHFNPAQGGYNFWNGSTGTKTDYANIHATMESRTVGQRWNIFGQHGCFGGGDCVGDGQFVTNFGGFVTPGDEQVEAARFEADQGRNLTTATISAINGSVLTYSGATNGDSIGEQRPLIVPASSYATGTVAISGNTITGTGTAWQTTFGANRIVAFCLDANSGVISGNPSCQWANIDSDTTAHFVAPTGGGMGASGHTGSNYAFCYALINCSANYPYSNTGTPLGTGAYHMYKGAVVTQVAPNMATGVNGASGTITVADPTQFSVSDVTKELTAYNGTMKAGQFIVVQDLATQPQNGMAGYAVNIESAGATINSLLNLSGAAYNAITLSNAGGTAQFGMRFIYDPSSSWFYSPSTSGTAHLFWLNNGSSQTRYLQYDRTNDIYGWYNAAAGFYLSKTDGSGNLSASGNVAATAGISGAYGGFTSYSNLLQYSQFAPASLGVTWINSPGCSMSSIAANTLDVTDPRGGNTAEKIVSPASNCAGQPTVFGEQYQTIAAGLTTAQPYAISVWARGAVGGEKVCFEVSVVGQTYGCAGGTLTTEWKRYTYSFTSAGVTTPQWVIVGWSSSATYYVWGAQLEQSGTAGPYVPSTTLAVAPKTGGISTGDMLVTGNLSVIGDSTTNTLTVGSGGTKIVTEIKGTGTLTYTGITNATCQEQSLTITGAVAGDACYASPASSIGTNFLYGGCYVSAGDTAKIKVCNITAAPATPSAVSWTGWLKR